MNPNRIRNDIQNIIDLLAEKGISLFNQPLLYNRNGQRVMLSWRQSSSTLSKPQYFGTLDQYISILKDNSFTSLLLDGSIIRMSYTFYRNDLVSHNLWYYPCPLNLPKEELLSEPVIDIIDSYSDQHLNLFRFRGPLRFDYDSDRAEEINHPASHVHFIHESCRTPVKRPLSPGTFTKFIFYNFYKEIWDSYEFLKELPEEKFNQTIFPQEEEHIHFAWR